MANFRRFGRRMQVASTLAISHDLRAIWAEEKARKQVVDSHGQSLDGPATDVSPNEVNRSVH